MINEIQIHPSLLAFQESLGLKIENLLKEKESEEYGAYEFVLNQKIVKFRVSKQTPKKVGQFVTFWKRENSIVPHHQNDPFDLLIISSRHGNNTGYFIFHKTLLCEKGLISTEDKRGKLGFRIYPSWDNRLNAQASKTQAWQLPYFFDGKFVGSFFNRSAKQILY